MTCLVASAARAQPNDAEATDAAEATDDEESASTDEGSASTDEESAPAAPTAQTSAHLPIELTGYLRARGEWWDGFHLGRTDGPFARFRSSTDGVVPVGGCDDAGGACSGAALRFANTRLRLRPTIHVGDDVAIHATIDVFDNLVLGSTPTSSGASLLASGPMPAADTFAFGQNPPQGGRNNLSDSILVRHVWGEVRARSLGRLRFGRMPAHFGLGMVWNDGMGIDADASTDVDRIELSTEYWDLDLRASFDFASKGILAGPSPLDPRGLYFDGTSRDDVRQIAFVATHRLDEQERTERLRAGRWVLEGGYLFSYRWQFLSSASTTAANPMSASELRFVRRNADLYLNDVWGRFSWGALTVEAEAAFVAGSIENILTDAYRRDDALVRQVGLTLQASYRLLDDRLALRFHTGLGTGDEDVDGLSSGEDLLTQRSSDRMLTHFAFHPNHRVDLILWRSVLGQVGGAWYMKPGASYELVRNADGHHLGFDLDLIYSRATRPVQAYGADANLGVEIDAGIRYRADVGLAYLKAVFVDVQYGALFPLQGLGFVDFGGQTTRPDGVSLRPAQMGRLILGVQF